MSLFIDGFADLAFSGVPSSAVYDVLKQLWQKMSKRDWNNLFLDAFEQVIRDEQPRLQQYVKGDGDIDIDRSALSKILHQELDQDVLSPRYSELTSDGKVSVLVQAMVEQDVLILGGHSLSQTGYRHLIWNLVQKVKDKFKAAILQRPQLYQEVLLDETLGNRQVIEQASQYLSQEFNLIQSQLTAIERQINHLPSSIAADLSNNLSLPLVLEHQAELDYARNLINQYNPQRALDYLLDLEQRIWHTAQPLVKYRLIANIGAAELGLRREKEAAKHFIQALQFNPNDEKALYFAALGHILLGQEPLAKAIIEHLLAQNPANENAYSLLVQISHSEDFEVVLESVPEAYRNSTDVAYALGSLAHYQSNDAQARHWFQVAMDNDTRNSFDPKVSLATLILEQVSADPFLLQSQQLKDADQNQIETAIELLTEAWARIEHTDLRTLHPELLMNRGMAHAMLGRVEDAIVDLDLAIQIAPTNGVFRQNRALLARDTGDYARAIKMLESLVGNPQTPDAEIILAEVLGETKAYDQAIPLVRAFLSKELSLPRHEQAQRLLVKLLINTNKMSELIELYNKIQSKFLTTIPDRIDAANIANALGRVDDALQNLEEARSQLSQVAVSSSVLALAEAYYFLKQYEVAASLYERCVNSSLNTPLNHRLIECHYRSGRVSLALTICQTLRQQHGISRLICEVEFAIHQQIGDLVAAKAVCQDYLNQYPDDTYIQVHLASTNYRLRCFSELDAFLNATIGLPQLPLVLSLNLAYLYAFRGQFKLSLTTLYQIRKQWFNDSRAHVAYALQFFEYDKFFSAAGLLNHEIVQVNSAVCLEDDTKQQTWYIVVDTPDPNIQQHEISQSDSLAQKLLDRRIGDEVVLRETSFSKDTRKIVNVVSQYQYALWESLDLIQHRFPDAVGVWTVNIKPDEFDSGMPESIATVVNSNTDVFEYVETVYKQTGLPIATFAKFVQRDVVSVRDGLIHHAGLGIRCCQGDQQERDRALSQIAVAPVKLVIDLITLLTLHNLNAADVVVGAFGRLCIAQSEIDQLQDVIERNKAWQTKESYGIGKDGDHFVLEPNSQEAVRQYNDHLQKVLHWIDLHCDVLPCRAALDLAPATKREMETLIGASAFSTLLIASEPGYVLYSDDWALRQVAKAKFNIEGVWTQIVLMQCCTQGAIARSDYSQMVIHLIQLNHHYTSIDAPVLVEAARQANWMVTPPLTPLLKFLGADASTSLLTFIYDSERSSLDTTIQVIVDFLYELWKVEISYDRRNSLAFEIFRALMRGRKHRAGVIRQIQNAIRLRFCWLPLAEQQILSLLSVWRQTNIV